MLVSMLIAYLFLGGAGGVALFSKQDRARVKTVIVEQQRAQDILNQMAYMERTGSDESMRVTQLLNAWAKKDRDHAVGGDSLDPVIEEALTARSAAQGSFLDALFAMKHQMSRDEWEQVFRPED